MIIMCMDNRGFEDCLTISKIYKVIDDKHDDDYFIIINDKGDAMFYDKKRFKQTPATNTAVECIKKRMGGNCSLTIGNIYEIIEEFGQYYRIRNDNGIDDYYYNRELFKPAQ